MRKHIHALFVLLAACSIPALAHAQDPKPAAQIELSSGHAVRVGNPVEHWRGIDFTTPFQGAGWRSLSAIGDASRLVYVLWTKNGQALPESGDVRFDSAGISTEWLREELKRQFSTLAEVQTLTTLSRREGATDSVYTTEVSVEIVGPRDAVGSAEQFLDRYVADNRRLVSIESVVMTGTDDSADATSRDIHIDFLERAAFDSIVVDENRRGAFEVTTAPTITAFGEQRAQIQVVNQVPYVKSWDVEVVREQKIASPEIEVLNEGLMLEVVPTVVGDRVLLDVDLKLSKVQEITSTPMTLSFNTEPVKVDQPVVENVHWACSDAQLSPETPVIRIRGLSIRDHDKVKKVDLLLRAAVVEAEAAAIPAPIGIVLGFDPATREVFCRYDAPKAGIELRSRRLEIVRDSSTVGHAVVVEVDGGLLRLRLEDGEAKAGDTTATAK